MEQVERLIADRVFAGSGIPDLLSSDIFQNIGGIPKGAELAVLRKNSSLRKINSLPPQLLTVKTATAQRVRIFWHTVSAR